MKLWEWLMPWRQNGDRRQHERIPIEVEHRLNAERRVPPDEKDRQLQEEARRMREFLEHQHDRLREAAHHHSHG